MSRVALRSATPATINPSAKILARAASLRSTSSLSSGGKSGSFNSSSSSSSLNASAPASAAAISSPYLSDEQRQRLREKRLQKCNRAAAAASMSSSSSSSRPSVAAGAGASSFSSAAVAAAAAAAASTDKKKKIVVTGAGGRTGKLAVEYLLARPELFDAPVAVARSEKALKEFAAKGAKTAVVDVTAAAETAEAALVEAFAGADAVIIATSAVPKIQKRSLVKVILAKIFKRQGVRPTFTWKGGNEKGAPVAVDWLGQKVQIDAAVKAGVKRVVIISSMGVTQPENFLNTIADGKILLYKRKAEEYLLDLANREGKIEACVVHPGGLIDQPGGEREIVLGLDDTLLKGTVRSIPRADVAALSVACATLPEAKNVSLDAVAKPPGEGVATKDFAALLRGLGGRTAKYLELPAEARV